MMKRYWEFRWIWTHIRFLLRVSARGVKRYIRSPAAISCTILAIHMLLGLLVFGPQTEIEAPAATAAIAAETAERCVHCPMKISMEQECAPRVQISRLKRIFAEEGVPWKFVRLAEVESSWNPDAMSSAGAVGLYQLMPDTAKRFGLRVHHLEDDRFDPYASARAAAKYLKILHRRFGTWSLALAAYNAGEGRIHRTLAEYGATCFEEIAIFLPRETQNFVPKVMALVITEV